MDRFPDPVSNRRRAEAALGNRLVSFPQPSGASPWDIHALESAQLVAFVMFLQQAATIIPAILKNTGSRITNRPI
jgi:hypothetical protein